MHISQHISELLFNHECVIVPDLGGFVSNYQSAKIHPVQHNFHPPTKNILFNKELNKNDGLLANHLVVAEKMTYEIAMETIRDFSRDVILAIGNGEKVSLENVGTLYADLDGNIQFKQEAGVNYLKEAYGLSSFVSPAIRRQYGKTPRTTQPTFSDRRTNPQKKKGSGALVRVAAVASILILMSAFSINYFTAFNPETSQSSVMPVISLNNSHDEQIKNTATEKPTFAEETVNTAPEENSNKTEKEADATIAEIVESVKDKPLTEDANVGEINLPNNEPTVPEITPAKVPIPTAKMYHLIAGSFQESENAESLITEFSQHGYSPAILAPLDNGYFRVSIAAYLRKDEALAELKKVRDNFNPNVWLLRQ